MVVWKKVCLLFFCLLLVSCEENTIGTLTVEEDISLNASNSEAINLARSRYPVSLKISASEKGRGRAIITINGSSAVFSIPPEANVPKDNGTISLSSQLSGQPYDLSGHVSTNREVGEIVYKYELCSHRANYCHPDPEYGCRYSRIRGFRRVAFRDTITTKKYNVNFLEESRKVANLETSRKRVYRTYVAVGVCF